MECRQLSWVVVPKIHIFDVCTLYLQHLVKNSRTSILNKKQELLCRNYDLVSKVFSYSPGHIKTNLPCECVKVLNQKSSLSLRVHLELC